MVHAEIRVLRKETSQYNVLFSCLKANYSLLTLQRTKNFNVSILMSMMKTCYSGRLMEPLC